MQHDEAGGTAMDGSVTLTVEQERRLVPFAGGHGHLVCRIRAARPTQASSDRRPVSIALVLDRSGSMQGEKLETARRAGQLVVDALDERDRLAVVTFDNEVAVLQPAAAVTAAVKAQVHRGLALLQAGATTALHEGWLTGCREIAGNGTTAGWSARCLLLTDGLANVGITDPETIAAQAAGVRANAGVGTSTFGIGPDYDEALLGPMAVAGGGQFHHLRTAAEIARSFAGELGGLLAVAVTDVRLEIEADVGNTLDLVSEYWAEPSEDGRKPSLTVAIGDLMAGEERTVVVRAGVPGQARTPEPSLRLRLTWQQGLERRTTDWQTVHFAYASRTDCHAEARDSSLLRRVGLQHADRAQRQAATLNRRGELVAARQVVEAVARRIKAYAGNDPELGAAHRELLELADEAGAAPMAPMVSKELYSAATRRSRGQTDYRTEPPPTR